MSVCNYIHVCMFAFMCIGVWNWSVNEFNFLNEKLLVLQVCMMDSCCYVPEVISELAQLLSESHVVIGCVCGANGDGESVLCCAHGQRMGNEAQL